MRKASRSSGGCVLAVLMVATPAFADVTKTVCGLRTGTAGNASLQDDKGSDMIVLAEQGGDQRLLEAADDLLPAATKDGEQGTQNGERYCLKVRYDYTGKPVKIIAASRRK